MSKFNDKPDLPSHKVGKDTEVYMNFTVDDVSDMERNTTLADVIRSVLYVSCAVGAIKLLGMAALHFQFGGWWPMIFPLISAGTLGLAANCKMKIEKFIKEKTGLKTSFHYDSRYDNKQENSQVEEYTEPLEYTENQGRGL